MIVKRETNDTKNTQLNIEVGYDFENRWNEGRRKEPSKGFTYISSVGWIDRREMLRRKDDPYKF
jgi:hypothetical protein